MAATYSILLGAAAFALFGAPANAGKAAASSAAISSETEAIQQRLASRGREHRQSMARLTANMTLESAMQVLRASGSARGDQMAFLEGLLASSAAADAVKAQHAQRAASDATVESSAMEREQHAHRASVAETSRHLRAGGRATAAAGSSHLTVAAARESPKYAAGVETAKVMLNEMIEQVMESYEEEQRECCNFENERTAELEETRQDISSAMVESAEARREILDAEARIADCEVNIPKTIRTLDDHNERCRKDLAELRLQLAVVNNDSVVMGNILDLIECEDDEPKLLLLRCTDRCTGQAVVSPHHAALKTALAALKSSETSRLVSSGFAEAYESPATALVAWPNVSGDETRTGLCQGEPIPITSDIKMGSKMTCEKACLEDTTCTSYCHGSGADATCYMYTDCSEQVYTEETSDYTCYERPALPAMETREFSSRGPCKYDPTDRTSDCSITTNPNCAKLQDKFMSIRADLVEKQTELTKQIGDLEASCQKTRELLNLQIEDYRRRLADAQTDLATGTRKQNEAEGTSALKNRRFSELTTEYWDRTRTCHENYAKFESEECGLKKIRGELYKMKASTHPAFFQDCEVSDWGPDGEGCSRPCDGGLQIMRRQIVNLPDGGAQCPPLEAKMLCNQHPCPKDCKYTDWGGWSQCSGECGGGTRERTRTIMQKAAYGGEPCADERETETCHVESCDKECELSDWSEWGSCSKQCNTGHRVQTREIDEPAVGEGGCPSEHSSRRFRSENCNQQPCTKAGQYLQCDSAVDVVLALDGSLSLGNLGWYATKRAAKHLVKAIGNGRASSRVKVLLYSGPLGKGAWNKIQMCNGLLAPDWSGGSMEEVCKMQWLNEDWTSDTDAAIKAIDDAKWPMGTTQTAIALGLAETAMGSAREGVKKRVVFITDGKPMYSDRTYEAAVRLKKKAELYMVPVTTSAPPIEQVNEWASFPSSEHVVSAKTWFSLWSTDFTDQLVANMCPSVS